jgi:alkyl sulfatase BDS1-like metallo-beta-lactamase superfamily hydrolase
MGGAAAVTARAREDFARGDFRWVAEVMNQVVMAEPANQAARQLQADALEQLGYQAESGVWRNVYLSGARELREGLPQGASPATTSADVVRAIPLDLFFDYVAVRLNPAKAAGKHLDINWTVSAADGSAEKVWLSLENSALSHVMGRHADKADAAVTIARATLDQINLQRKTFAQAAQAGEAKIEGNGAALAQLLGMLDSFATMFEIVTPLGSEAALAPAK